MNKHILAWAQAALAQYDLRSPELHFLGHSDNITFRVEEAGGTLYLLRLHSPALPYWAGIRQLPEVIASELAWLEALGGAGHFPVQHPLRTRAGELVALVTQDSQQAVPATLLTWREGVHFVPAAPDANEQVQRFGELVGRLHEFSRTWQTPAGFTRPSYDAGHFRRIFARLLRGVDQGVFSEELYWTLRTTGQAIQAEISALPGGAEHWGVVHADLHVGNFLVNDGQIIPIDFSFCGFGHYLFDLSVCLAGGLNTALRPIFLQGYRGIRALPESDLRAMDAYALSGMLSYYAYQIDNPAERTWLQRRIPEVVRGECTRFLQGDRVI